MWVRRHPSEQTYVAVLLGIWYQQRTISAAVKQRGAAHLSVSAWIADVSRLSETARQQLQRLHARSCIRRALPWRRCSSRWEAWRQACKTLHTKPWRPQPG